MELKISKRLALDLSGFGGGYENHCQILMQAGLQCLEWDPKLKEVDPATGRYFKERIDLLQDRMIYLTKEWGEDAGGTTGAQMSVATSAALAVDRMGWAEWIREIAKADRLADLYEWDGTKESCPATPPYLEEANKQLREDIDSRKVIQ